MTSFKSSVGVVIDATSMPPNRGGVGRYLEGLLPSLGQNKHLNLGVICQQRDAEEIRSLLPRANILIAPKYVKNAPLRLIWEQLFMVQFLKKYNYSILHSPHYTFPIFWRNSRVVTVHDATFFSHPQAHKKVKVIFFKFWTKLAWKYSDVLIAPSKETFSQLSIYLKPRNKKNIVAYHGVDTKVFHPANEQEISSFLTKWHLSGKSIVGFLGTIEPRKNVPMLIKAVDRINLLQQVQKDITLVIAGAKGWDSSVEEALNGCVADTEIVSTGYLDLEEVRAFLSSVDILAYPSSAEGFGFPVLEAMACKAAVISSPLSAIPEIGGDSIAYALPDTKGLSESITDLMLNNKNRLRLSEAGYKRSQNFTWKKSAASHVNAYREAVFHEQVN